MITRKAPPTPERLAIVRDLVKILHDHGIKNFSAYTAITDKKEQEHLLVFEIGLEDGPSSRMADIIFHGTEEAHNINTAIFIEGGFRALYDAARCEIHKEQMTLF